MLVRESGLCVKNDSVDISEYLASNCDSQRTMYLKGVRKKRFYSDMRYQFNSCLEDLGKTTIKPRNSRCPDREMKHAPLEHKCETNTASHSLRWRDT